jgi:hypothetical protein
MTGAAEPVVRNDLPNGKTLFWTFVKQGASSGSPEYRRVVTAEWLSSHKLKIAYPSWLKPTVLETHFNEVEVEYDTFASAPPP